jgi:prenyltransferase beta subunit
MINMQTQIQSSITQSINFITKCRIGKSWAFLPHLKARKPTLYSSSFAVMSFSYTNKLKEFSQTELISWGEFFSKHQSATDGLFESDELFESPGELHNIEHRKLHLTCHILPAMAILDVKPNYRITYIDKYKDIAVLSNWLDQVDLSKSWIEGNNLLFMGQILWFEYNNYNDLKAKNALDHLMLWLNENVDAETGLWGTNKGCSLHQSMYGSYHQLILYFFQNIEPLHFNNLIDSTLQCQHFDGGFRNGLGGGTCQDIDGIDILVKAAQLSDYRSNDIKLSLWRAMAHILRDRQAKGGGFIDSPGRKFIHNSMPATSTDADVANTFSTWFTLHAIANIAPIIELDICLQYNNSMSMGWGENRKSKKTNTIIESNIIKSRALFNTFISKLVIILYKLIKNDSRG